jgi:hypothetical protein
MLLKRITRLDINMSKMMMIYLANFTVNGKFQMRIG